MRQGPPDGVGRALLGSWALGACYGACDALGTALADTLPPSAGRVGALVLGSGFVIGSLAMAGAYPLIFALRRHRLPLLGPALGAAMALLLDLGERWFSQPPPFAQSSALHGSPLVFAGMALGVLLAALGLALLGRFGRAASLPLTLVFLAVLVAGWPDPRALPPQGVTPSMAWNVLFVTLDTTRADHTATFGSSRTRTPNLDRLAREGVAFDHAYSQIPVTAASHTTMMTGTGPWTHGVLLNGRPIPTELETLAETLRRAGWRTGAFVSSYVLDGKFGLARGFEVYDDDFGRLPGWGDTLGGRLEDLVSRHLHPDLEVERKGGETVDHALSWMDGVEGAPFFAWVHLFDPHGPYTPPPPWDTAYYEGDPRDPGKSSMRKVQNLASYLLPWLRGVTDLDWVLAQYDGEISYADAMLGRLLDRLDQGGVADHTVVVVVGDHGESLGEHDVWFNHGDDLFEAETHVPLVIRAPGLAKPGIRVDFPVELLDLAPTVDALLGVPAPATVEGFSLLDWLSGSTAAPPRDSARSFAYDRPTNLAARARGEIQAPEWRMVALRGLDWRYLFREGPGLGASWYDMTLDPGEASPRPAPAEQAAALQSEVQALLRGP